MTISDTSSQDNIIPETIVLVVNGVSHEFEIGDRPYQVAAHHTLSQTLRDTLGFLGTKIGCNRGACASCTVIMDGKSVLSCMALTIECHGRRIQTIEGLRDPETGTLDSLQQSFVDHTAFQCGFCTPGMIMASKSLLDENPHPQEQDVKEALAGHFCRCISHYHVIDAVMDTVSKRRA